MKTTDLRPLMVFLDTQNTGFGGRLEFVVDRLEVDKAHGRFMTFHGGDKAVVVPLADLLDSSKWTFDEVLTAKVMHEKIVFLQAVVQSLKPPPPKDYPLGKAEPHEYVETEPYRGCASCGVGPGAAHHNSHEVRRYREQQAHEAVTTAILSCNGCGAPLKQGEMMVCAHCEGVVTTLDPNDPTKINITFKQSPYQRAVAKGQLEKARRIQLMGRVDELKAALEDAKRGFELELPGQWPERFHMLLQPEKSADPKDWGPRYDYKATPTSPLSWPEGVTRVLYADTLSPQPEDPFHELSSVLWFLASLTSDHEPGCMVKDGKGDPCDCEVTLREGEPWWKRVRASLSLPGALKGRLERAEAQLKARRVVQVKPVAGAPGPNGDGTVYEFKMPTGKVEHLMVVRHVPGSLNAEQMRATSEALRKKLPGVLVLFAQPDWELTLLELP